MSKRASHAPSIPHRHQLALQEAVAAYTRGDWNEAERLCRRILKAMPGQFDTLHLLGIIAAQTQRTEEAAALLGRAVAINPSDAAAHSNRGNALQALRRLEEALASYDRALALKPDFAQACINRGSALQDLGRFEEALASYDRALALQPDYPEAHYNRAVALQDLKRPAEALASYGHAIALRPDYPEAHRNRGVALQGLDRLPDALACHERALALRPEFAEAHSSRGVVLQALDRPAEALDSFERAIALAPGFAEAHGNRGVALLDLGRPSEALASYDRALALQPDYAEAHANRGAVLQSLRRLKEALASYDRALALRPEHAGAWSGRGIVLQEMNRLVEALQCYERAIAIAPDFAEAHFNLSTLCLMQGDFARGWQKYEWRWRYKKLDKTLGKRRAFAQPQWTGAEPLEGRTLLLHAEQGFGDTIQFCRYALAASARGARVILEVPRPLRALLSNLAGVAQLVEDDGPLPAIDFHCPLMSLPHAFSTTPDTVPTPGRYIESDPVRVARWRAELGEPRGMRVGLSWSGSHLNVGDAKRSITLAELVAHLPPQHAYFSLQKDLREGDAGILAANPNIRHMGADFADTAALCELMDVVISVDTSIAHLAGALGRPVWVLLPVIPDWRWQLKGETSPWYRSARLLRQQVIGDWGGVLGQVRAGLLALSPAPPAAPAAT